MTATEKQMAAGSAARSCPKYSSDATSEDKGRTCALVCPRGHGPTKCIWTLELFACSECDSSELERLSIAALESLLPSDLEGHLQINSSRFSTSGETETKSWLILSLGQVRGSPMLKQPNTRRMDVGQNLWHEFAGTKADRAGGAGTSNLEDIRRRMIVQRPILVREQCTHSGIVCGGNRDQKPRGAGQSCCRRELAERNFETWH